MTVISSLMMEDHGEVGDVLDQVELALGSGDASRAFPLLDLLWARLAVHIRAEHLCIFPAVLNGPREWFSGGVNAPRFEDAQSTLSALKLDHDFFMRELAGAVNRMRETKASGDDSAVSGMVNDVQGIVVAVRERLDLHNELEEEQVYKWIDALLDEEAQALLIARVNKELRNAPPRFSRGLASKLSDWS